VLEPAQQRMQRTAIVPEPFFTNGSMTSNSSDSMD
jgi:hypothetical protein